MKKIICKKEYDTETATLIKKTTVGSFGDPAGYEESSIRLPGDCTSCMSSAERRLPILLRISCVWPRPRSTHGWINIDRDMHRLRGLFYAVLFFLVFFQKHDIMTA